MNIIVNTPDYVAHILKTDLLSDRLDNCYPASQQPGMKEQIDRRNDEGLYQPKIHSDRIRTLYKIREATGLPMTVLVDLAIERFLETYGRSVSETLEEYDSSQAC